VSLPISSASLRLVVIWESDQCAERTQGREHHGLPSREIYHVLRPFRENVNKAAIHFFEVEYTTAVKGLPHSKQRAFSRDVINPQDGHILCD
jgi:hypothetical protein